MTDINTIETQIRREAGTVLFRVILFIVYYTFLILLGLAFFAIAFQVSIILLFNLDVIVTSVRLLVIVFMLWLAMWVFCFSFGKFLVKPLFTFHKYPRENCIEVTPKECPDLFKMIREIASATGNKMPKHVFLSPEVNAYVSYNSTGFWALFLPTPKNLTLGVALLQNMNHDEIKAILGHEFGHFSQQTMRVGSLTYRLLLIIRDMIEHARKSQEAALVSSADQDTWSRLFHISSGFISFVTRKTISLYNYIEKANRSLSRLMEFEADAMACRIVGAKPFVSSLCKLDVMGQRYQIFETAISNWLIEKKVPSNYWQAFAVVDGLLAKDDQISFGSNDLLTTPAGEEPDITSKVTIIDGWNTHPSTHERIENSKQFAKEEKPVDLTEAWAMIPEPVLIKSGEHREKAIASNVHNLEWSDVTIASTSEFEKWVTVQFEQYRVPAYMQPFANRRFDSFPFPTEEEQNVPVDNPFTPENRKLYLEYQQVAEDFNTLNELQSGDTGVKHFLFEGQTYEKADVPIKQQKRQLEEMANQCQALDRQIFLFALQNSKNKEMVKTMYWIIYYSREAWAQTIDLRNMADAIYQQAALFHQNGKKFYLNDEIKQDMAYKFWKFTKVFNYENYDSICGSWQVRETVIVRDVLQSMYKFANQENPSTETDELLQMIIDSNNMFADLYNDAKNRWSHRIVCLYYGKRDETDHLKPNFDIAEEDYHVTQDNVWDSSLEVISEAEKIRYKIYKYVGEMKSGDILTVENVFGKEGVSADEYIEFLKVSLKISDPYPVYVSDEELHQAEVDLKEDDDNELLKIGNTYLGHSDFDEAIKWWNKAADLGNSDAMCRLASSYKYGNGVEKSIEKSFLLYKEAIATDGNSDALLDLGLCYLKGEGVPINDEHGFLLMERSAKQGNMMAQYNMGVLYRSGRSVEANMEEALRWYRLSAAQGYDKAVDFLKKYESME